MKVQNERLECGGVYEPRFKPGISVLKIRCGTVASLVVEGTIVYVQEWHYWN